MIRTVTIFTVILTFAGALFGGATGSSSNDKSSVGGAGSSSTKPAGGSASSQGDGNDGRIQNMLAHARRELANGSIDHARRICEGVLTFAPHNPEAIGLMGQIRIDGKWLAFDQARECVAEKIRSGKSDWLLSDGVLDDMLSLAGGDEEKCAVVGELLGRSQIRASRFAQAQATFARLGNLPLAGSAKYKALADVLAANPDGIFVLSRGYPAQAILLGKTKGVLQPGPINLSHELAVEAVLEQKACEQIDLGTKLEARAQTSAMRDPNGADVLYAHSDAAYKNADELSAGSSRLQRISLAEKRIKLIDDRKSRKMSEFNARLAKLGQEKLSADQYASMLASLRRDLDFVLGDVRRIIELASPFAGDFTQRLAQADDESKKLAQLAQTLSVEAKGDNEK